MSYIPENLRRLVIERARGSCEYCFLPQQESFYPHEIDHIIPVKHRGGTTEENLCLACFECNRSKGSDFASFEPETSEIIPLFNPRQQIWQEHFELNGASIIPLSAVGRVTEFVLKLNSPTRLIERQILLDAGRYPPATDK
jgi:hypothetical protein